MPATVTIVGKEGPKRNVCYAHSPRAVVLYFGGICPFCEEINTNVKGLEKLEKIQQRVRTLRTASRE